MKKKKMGFYSEELEHHEKNVRVMDELKRYFNPEFLNRIDEVVWFHPLNIDQIKDILEKMLEDLEDLLEEKGFAISFSPKVKEFLVKKGFDEKYGARPLRRAIEREVEDPLALEMLKSKYEAPGIIQVNLRKDEIKFKLKKEDSSQSKKADAAEGKSQKAKDKLDVDEPKEIVGQTKE